jgi:hypothetical protein
MKTQHTSTPWSLFGHGNPQVFGGDPLRRIAVLDRQTGQSDGEYQANAERIVLCVNEHTRLLEALRRLTTLAANVCAQTDGIGVINAVAELRPAIPDMRSLLARSTP